MTQAKPAPDGRAAAFPVVGIGASAGGLEALRELFDNMPTDADLAFVVVTHQHPGHTSVLPELLSRNTKMPVLAAKDGMVLEPNHVYVSTGVPITLEANALREHEPEDRGKPPLPVDLFFRSLAESRRHGAACIVLSGTGTDGTLGLKAVKGEGGLTMVQEATSARYQGMPSSAIATARVDYILPVSEMPARLTDYCGNLSLSRTVHGGKEEESEPPRALQDAFRLLRSRTGHDFSDYKTSTLRRADLRLLTSGLRAKPALVLGSLRERQGRPSPASFLGNGMKLDELKVYGVSTRIGERVWAVAEADYASSQ